MDDPPGGRPLSGQGAGAGTGRQAVAPPGLDGTVVLLRHGESTWVAEGRFQGQGDPPLSAPGRHQAELAAGRLARPHRSPALAVPIGSPLEVVHSPLRRTTETAEFVTAALTGADGFEVEVPRRPDAGFLEIGQGEWEGLPATEIQARWPDVIAGWRRDPLSAWAPGGESVPEVDARARASLGSLLGRLHERGGGSDAHRSHVLGYGDAPSRDPWSIVVGHDGVFKVSLLALMDLPLERFWSFPFALCGISIVEFRAGRPRLRAHNLTDHLAPFEDERAQAIEAERSRTGAL